MVDDAVGGLLRILGCTAFAAIVIGGALHSREVAAGATRVGRFLHLMPPAAPTPLGPPLERIGRDLRRLEPEARRPREGTTHAKHRGVVAAYDDLLLEACRALEVPTSLGSLPDGLERETERIRVEYELEQSGLPIRTSS